jgi:hypothetical protein
MYRLLSAPEKRMAFLKGPNGTDKLRTHPFFAGLDWDDLRKHTPPFIPKVHVHFDSNVSLSLSLSILSLSQKQKILSTTQSDVFLCLVVWRHRHFIFQRREHRRCQCEDRL